MLPCLPAAAINTFELKQTAPSLQPAGSAARLWVSISVYQVLIDGVQTPVYFGQSGGFRSNPDGSFTFEMTFSVQKPVGYDGIVIGLNSTAIDARRENYLYDVYQPDQFLLFRIPG